MAIHISKPSKELLQALEAAGVLKPQQQQQQQQQPKTNQQFQGDLVMQLARQTGLSEELVMSVLEVILKRAKEGKPAVPKIPMVPASPITPEFVQSPSSDFGMPPELSDKYDETLTVGLASGLDVPTAIVLAEGTRRQSKKGNWWAETWALIVMVVVSFVWLLLRYLK